MSDESKCGKKSYDCQRSAKSALNLIKKSSSRSHIPKREYYCSDCKKWHLSSMGEFNDKKK